MGGRRANGRRRQGPQLARAGAATGLPGPWRPTSAAAATAAPRRAEGVRRPSRAAAPPAGPSPRPPPTSRGARRTPGRPGRAERRRTTQGRVPLPQARRPTGARRAGQPAAGAVPGAGEREQAPRECAPTRLGPAAAARPTLAAARPRGARCQLLRSRPRPRRAGPRLCPRRRRSGPPARCWPGSRWLRGARCRRSCCRWPAAGWPCQRSCQRRCCRCCRCCRSRFERGRAPRRRCGCRCGCRCRSC
mmetsp:Transcript_4152/g.17496  ORF Transcript_4152/g.17496 Transcript_4152/m.17496 type:complete len:247 (-) Transcript_4152:1945-2685(-)